MALYTPRKHQLEFRNFHRNSGRLGSLAWHGMGLGKTTSGLWEARQTLYEARQSGATSPLCLVICPKSAINTWKKECDSQTPDIFRQVKIVPYSQLHNAIKSVAMMDVRMIIFDESHYLKSPKTSRVKTLAAFLHKIGTTGNCFKGGRIIMATGTPMPNGAHEIFTSWAICCAHNLVQASEWLLDGKRYENWEAGFTESKTVSWEEGWGKNKRKKTGTVHVGAAHEDMLQQLLSPFVHFKRVSDCVDLPPKQEIHVDLNLPDDKLLKDANIERPEPYMALVERLSRAKTPHMLDWVEDYLTKGQENLLVFAMNRAPLEALKAKFPNDVRMLTGSEKESERVQNFEDFKAGKFRVLAMTYKCGSESLNLQNCRVSLYHGWLWTDSGLKQAIARTYRQGQAGSTLHYFLTSGENDSRMLNIIRGKEEATTRVEDGLLAADREKSSQVKWTLDDLI